MTGAPRMAEAPGLTFSAATIGAAPDPRRRRTRPRKPLVLAPALLFGAALLAAALGILASCSRPGGPAAPAPAGRTAQARPALPLGPGGPAGPSSAVVFVPFRYYAGDEVEALVALGEVPGASGGGFELKPGSGLPAPGPFADPVIRSIAVARTKAGWEARILFVSWSPGPGSLPSIGARGFLIPAVSYNVSSSLGPGDRDAAPPRPQREPPGTAVYLYGFAALVLALVLAALGTALYLVPAALSLLARRRAAQAIRRLRRSLAFLSRGLDTALPELFYAALARELRIYLAARVEPRAPNLSSGELAALPEEAFPAPGLRERAASLVAETERGRYALELSPGPGAAAMLRAAAERTLALGEAAEEAIDARV